ncbi:cell division cycle-associated protein 7-like [Hypomesus transpacificus]|uniref:cell division cycle-associated protein 7-like n=1 Tax=Hypomesus transpacificus TaxID=137520 RepID=UPI001F0745D9|nr:cell division cycle-associated protein 7-like [Hypomesus transpacificus]
MDSLARRVADIFDEESENDQTFHGFSDSEISDLLDIKTSDSGDGVSVTRTPAPPRFQLRVSLRSQPAALPSSEEDERKVEEKKVKKERNVKKKEGNIKEEKKDRKVKEEMEDVKLVMTAAFGSGSDSEVEEPKSFLDKRAQNIKANKAMLARLMADLQQMPGGERLLKNQGAKRLKEKTSRPPWSGQAGGGSRRNPERMSRRRTRSMGPDDDAAAPPELELSLEDELLEVRGASRRRGNPRPYQGKAHVGRPVEEVTEEELELVADSLTEKVYSSSTGTTCHQCRQKTVDTKTSCRSETCRGLQGQFCGPCLRNRYGENVKTALLDPMWTCPPCRGICNCSFCRLRDGRCPTGILLPLAQYHGFSDVHSYLSSLRDKLKTVEEEESV